ncbi:ABC transporter substrate-binding protein [Saccharomonospora viridis]|jgi:polar amino acid transport system substrate-binding protein|uniref:Glutamine-binding protein n=1 Tax=Saccharomonospora viridis TaxID=1852 RepID=A0A837D7Y2_9PSEU|nr:ABC transporter substrate-binding protein [Saccharomonospora viridis]KHF42938.1 glutamine-binding protein [Saccharomonospora viridis]SFO87998.1 amino acid ABC transporter substrate-binding protein, PAAT family [Saccharomonospora viridis]
MTDGRLRLACIDSDAPPLFLRQEPDGRRRGFEPAAAELVAAELGLELEWVVLPWSEMIPAVQDHRADGVWCGQGVTEERRRQVDFTRPYAIFDESVLVRRGSGVRGPADLVGRRVAAIAGSANMALAETFDGAVVVPFDGGSDDVFGDMLSALRAGEVDAVVDDDVVFVPLGEDPDFEVAFTHPTRNRWAVGVAKDRPELRRTLDEALGAVIADGRLRRVWEEWVPGLDYPFASQERTGVRS